MLSSDPMLNMVSLCKRRGFVFQSSEIYGGLKSAYDYGPLGVELKRNLAGQWWKSMIYERDDIYGIDASILMHPDVWRASGHLQNFTDPLVDCFDCKHRFRADKAPKQEPGTEVEFRRDGKTIKGKVGTCGYACPNCSSNSLSEERAFRGMFQTTLGPIDPLGECISAHYGKPKEEFLQEVRKVVEANAVYLRPETAQAMFVQFQNVVNTTSAKVPFGIAQIGKSFRNEIVVEHFIFRSCEFEQMEMEFFCEPGSQKEWLSYWVDQRMGWYRKFANHPENFRVREHGPKELAHYSDRGFDIEYKFPWGFDELEGIASRTDFDLTQHAKASGTKLSYFDPKKEDPETGKPGWRYTPYVIEPAAGLTRCFLAMMLDAYTVEEGKDASGADKSRIFLKLHPALAPIKVAVFPLIKKDGQPEIAEKIAKDCRALGWNARYDDVASIGKRYAKHDEIGTPFCVTVDNQTVEDQTATVRDRNTTEQIRVPLDQLTQYLKERLSWA